jgi:V-type H+-transporting ATPase subunit a
VAENKIQFLNAYKMKVSIITGVIHMLFGVTISYFNHKFFQRRINILCEFIPQLIFMLFIFFYLCILVFHKWCAYSADGGMSIVTNWKGRTRTRVLGC